MEELLYQASNNGLKEKKVVKFFTSTNTIHVDTSAAVPNATMGPTSDVVDVNPIIGGSVGGGALVLCSIFCIFTCSIYLCKRRLKNDKMALCKTSQPVSAQSHVQTNGSIIRDMNSHLQSMRPGSDEVLAS